MSYNCCKYSCMNGRFVDFQGPYCADGHNNDEWILNSLSDPGYAARAASDPDNIYYKYPQQCDVFNKRLKIGDKFIVDRGACVCVCNMIITGACV